MEYGGDGCARLLVPILFLAVMLVVILFGAGWWEGNRAERVQAEVARVNAEIARDREANLHREYMFQAWTVALAAFASSNQVPLAVVAAMLGAACAVLVVRWWENRVGSS